MTKLGIAHQRGDLPETRAVHNEYHSFFSASTVSSQLTRTKMNYIHYKTSDDPESRIHQNWEETSA
jgi:hypothetical protein